MKKIKNVVIIVLCVVFLGVIATGIYYIVKNNEVNSPEKVTTDFVTALSSGNVKKALKYSAMDYEDYVSDFYGESNLTYLIEQNSNGIADDYSTAEEFYYAQEQNYQTSISSGKDMYLAMLNSIETSTDVKSIEIIETTQLDIDNEGVKETLNFYQRYNYDGIEYEDYYNPERITEAVKVEYKMLLEDGSENTYYLTTVYINGNWRVIVDLLDYQS